MTHVSLLDVIIEYRDVFYKPWTSEMEEVRNMGGFVFYPAGYTEVDSLDDVAFSFWELPRLCEAIEEERQMDEDLEYMIRNFDFDQNFLIVIIESKDGVHFDYAYYHKVPRFELVGRNLS